jgi:hypothetical protein
MFEEFKGMWREAKEHPVEALVAILTLALLVNIIVK